MIRNSLVAALCALAFVAPVAARPDDGSLTPQQKEAAARFEQSLHPQSGTIALPDGHATLDLGDRYVFFDPADTRRILVDAWGNPPSSADGVLGMIMPKGAHFYESWGAVVEYEDTGHVSDKDAASQDYDKVLADMKEATEQANEERRSGGYPAVHLVGWAQPPSYDATEKALIWARDIRFEGSSADTLNYDVRKLGRTGVLSLNMIDTMGDLPQIRTAAVDLGRTVKFDSSSTYGAFDPKTDHMADYGLAGLVAAGAGLAVAKKVGLLGILLLFLKKGLVIVAVAAAALWRRIKRLFGEGDEDEGGEDAPYAAGDYTADAPEHPEPLAGELPSPAADPYLATGDAADEPAPGAR